MAQQWMGFTISIDCGPMGVFQGVVTAVEAVPQSVTLSRVFHNGVPHTSPSIVISALDIKDLTIIAAPQAQLDPVVELKKPIPTRPGRLVGEKTQNFHSQPAPPRALHLNVEELDPRKAAVLLDYEKRTQPGSSRSVPSQLAHHQRAASNQATSLTASFDPPQQSPNSVQLSALQAALPDAFKVCAASQAAALALSPTVRQITKQASSQPDCEGAVKKMHSLSIASGPPSHGGFKMTSALSASQGVMRVNGNQSSSLDQYQPSTSRATLQQGSPQKAIQDPFAGIFKASSSSGTSQGATYSSKAAQASSSATFQLSASPQSSPLRGFQTKTAQGQSQGCSNEPFPHVSSAQAIFQGAAALSIPQGPMGRPQRGSAQASPHSASARYLPQGAAAQGPLQVNTDGYASGSGDVHGSPNKRDRLRQRWQARDEACFGSPSNNGFDQEFDFEKNLALFDKQAVYDEIATQRPDLVQAANGPKRQQNYRHDQNIIVNNRRIPTIIVPNPGSAEYVTDEGLIIPSMRPEMLRQLHQKAHDFGFSFDRQSEVLARCATEMSLQLLGGAHRLNPHNAHQWPTVIVMVGPHRQGAAGVMCARQLECQGISTVTLVVNETAAPTIMKRELNLYKCGGAPIVTSTDDLPDNVDLVIMALAGHLQADVANSLEYGKAASWASNKRASVLALDPPPVGTPGIITKFALAPTLPLTYSPQNGKIYLCNLGVPIVVFKEMGIRYRSPFGSKFVIPLHPNDE